MIILIKQNKQNKNMHRIYKVINSKLKKIKFKSKCFKVKQLNKKVNLLRMLLT